MARNDNSEVCEVRHESNHRFTYFLGVLIVLILALPLAEKGGIAEPLLVVSSLIIVLLSLSALGKNRKDVYIGFGLGALGIVLHFARYVYSEVLMFYCAFVFTIAFFAFVIWILFNDVFRSQCVAHEEIFGAISIYMLVAITFSFFYVIADYAEPGSFVKTLQNGTGQGLKYTEYLYYSFGELTTAGSGNIVEIGGYVHSLSMIEAVTGVFYVAFMIAKLVPIASFSGRR